MFLNPLLEATLFGLRKKGAFTGASYKRMQVKFWNRANQGQQFLLGMKITGKWNFITGQNLLRVLQEREVERLVVWKKKTIIVGCAVFGNHEPPHFVKRLRPAFSAKIFFFSLFFFKSSKCFFLCSLLPLRERPEDIVPLASAATGTSLSATVEKGSASFW